VHFAANPGTKKTCSFLAAGFLLFELGAGRVAKAL
jgi:hypothetical protein